MKRWKRVYQFQLSEGVLIFLARPKDKKRCNAADAEPYLGTVGDERKNIVSNSLKEWGIFRLERGLRFVGILSFAARQNSLLSMYSCIYLRVIKFSD